MREFVALSRTMSFTETAHELHMTQPNLSKHVRDMERELGATLIERGGVGGQSSLSIAGIRFLHYAKKAIADYDVIVRECQKIEQAIPPLRIQDVRHVVNVVPQLRGLMQEAADGVNYTHVAFEGSAHEALEGDVVDVAVILEPSASRKALEEEFPPGSYGILPLAPEPLLAMVGVASPYFKRASLALEEIGNGRILRGDNAFFDRASKAIAQVFEEVGCELSFVAYADHPFRGGAYPLEENDINICTRRFAQYYRDLDAEDFAVLEVEGFEPFLYPFLVFRSDDANSAARVLAGRID